MSSAHIPFSSRIHSLESENEQKLFNLYILITHCTCYASVQDAANAALTLSDDFSLSRKSTFSLKWTKMSARSKALQSIAIIVLLKQLSRLWTCQLHPTCSSNIFNLAVKVLFYSQFPPLCDAWTHVEHAFLLLHLQCHRSHVFAVFLASSWFGALQDDAAGQACFPECCRSDAMTAGVKTVGILTLHSDGSVLHPGL